MKKVIMLATLLIVAGLSACGGGGSDEPCSFDISDFTNGANATVTTSVWNCTSSASSYTFAFYNDGTGYSSALGGFTWEEVGCQQVDITDADGIDQIRNLEGSIASGIGTFTQTRPDGSELTTSCTLGTLAASVITSSSKDITAQLSLKTDCENGEFAKNLILTELDSSLWMLVNPANNEVISTFVDDYEFKMFSGECNLDNDEIICESNDCTFEYK